MSDMAHISGLVATGVSVWGLGDAVHSDHMLLAKDSLYYSIFVDYIIAFYNSLMSYKIMGALVVCPCCGQYK